MSRPQIIVLLVAAGGALTLPGCSRSEPSPSPRAEPVPALAQRIAIAVTADGFVPAHGRVRVGQPVTLVVTRKVERTCATDIVIKEYGVNKPLPQGQSVEIVFTPTKAGPIRYACAMDMVAGELVAE